MPSCAEVSNGITIETTKITSHEWQSKELILVNIFDRVSHVFDPRPIVTKPMVSILL